MAAAAAVRVIDGAEQAAALLGGERSRIVGALGQGDSSAGVARRLGLARQKVNYHLRELEKVGLVELVEERRRGNCIERIVRPVASAYVISPEALGAAAGDYGGARDRYSWATLVGAAANVIRDLGTLRRRADAVGKRVDTFTLETEVRFASQGALRAFTEAVSREVARLAEEHHDEHAKRGRAYRFVLGAYPKVIKTEDEAQREARAHDESKGDNGDKETGDGQA